jgi:hypothetical protein
MSDKGTKVSGNVAVKSGTPYVLCDGGSCFVAGPVENHGMDIGIYVIFSVYLIVSQG